MTNFQNILTPESLRADKVFAYRLMLVCLLIVILLVINVVLIFGVSAPEWLPQAVAIQLETIGELFGKPLSDVFAALIP